MTFVFGAQPRNAVALLDVGEGNRPSHDSAVSRASYTNTIVGSTLTSVFKLLAM